MLVRREVIDQIGYLDERFFAWQEDADYCFRARRAGWQVVYLPTAHITHYGGEGGSRVQPFRSIYEWHRSYFLYYRKNLAANYFFLFNGLFYLLMSLKLAFALLSNLVRRDKIAGRQRPKG
jgi:GT2 family glycosyltransferase